MKNTKRRLELFSLYDHSSMEQHLEKMVRQGWMLEKIAAFGWVYRRSEPKNGTFAVTYYPKASEFDPSPTDGEQMYQEFTASSGWQLICSRAQMQVFYTEQENPSPLETDPVTQVENIHEAAKKNFLFTYFLLLGVGILNAWQFVSTFSIHTLADPISLLSAACIGVLLIFCISELLVYFIWLTRARKTAQHGEFTPTPHTIHLQRTALILLVAVLAALIWTLAENSSALMQWCMTLMFGYMIILVLIVNAVKQLMKRMKVSRGANIAVTLAVDIVLACVLMGVVVHSTLQAVENGRFESDPDTYEYNQKTYTLPQDGLPLMLEDLINTDHTNFILEVDTQRSIFLSTLSGYQYSKTINLPDLEYNVTVVRAPFLYDFCKQRLLSKFDPKGDITRPHGYTYVAVDPTPWGAVEVYQLTGELSTQWYLICYNNRLVEIALDWEPTDEQKSIINEKLCE